MTDLLSFIKNNKFIFLAGILLILCCIKIQIIILKMHNLSLAKHLLERKKVMYLKQMKIKQVTMSINNKS